MTYPRETRAGMGLAGRDGSLFAMATRKPNLTSSERAATLTAAADRFAAAQFRREGRVPPAGLGQSTHHDVWIDLDDGHGPQDYPPKVILAWATGGELPETHGYSRTGVWLQRLEALGFPVLPKGPKGERPAPGRSCRGIDLDPVRGGKPPPEGTKKTGAAAVEPAQLLREDVLYAVDKIDASGNARRVSNDLHKTAWRIPANGRWYSMLAVLQIALRRHGIATLDQLKAVLRPKDGELQAVKWRDQLGCLGFPPQRGSSSPQDRKLGELDFAIRAKADPEELDLERFLEREDVPTEIRREGIARLTQGSFRQDLIAARHGAERCDVTGIAVPEVLRAGHIHRWADCKDTPAMRRDPANGLLLAAHLDALFEKGLIIFADDGRMQVSPELGPDERRLLQIAEPRRLAFKPTVEQCKYLSLHRDRIAWEGKTGHA